MNYKIKMLEPGFTGMNGVIGGVEFKDGVSVGEVNSVQMNRIGSAMRVERLGGGPVTDADRYMESKKDPAPMLESMKSGVAPVAPVAPVSAEGELEAPVELGDPATFVTKEQLEAIADEHGIAGLRNVASDFDVKSKSIPDLIEKILSAQGVTDREER